MMPGNSAMLMEMFSVGASPRLSSSSATSPFASCFPHTSAPPPPAKVLLRVQARAVRRSRAFEANQPHHTLATAAAATTAIASDNTLVETPDLGVRYVEPLSNDERSLYFFFFFARALLLVDARRAATSGTSISFAHTICAAIFSRALSFGALPGRVET